MQSGVSIISQVFKDSEKAEEKDDKKSQQKKGAPKVRTLAGQVIISGQQSTNNKQYNI